MSMRRPPIERDQAFPSSSSIEIVGVELREIARNLRRISSLLNWSHRIIVTTGTPWHVQVSREEPRHVEEEILPRCTKVKTSKGVCRDAIILRSSSAPARSAAAIPRSQEPVLSSERAVDDGWMLCDQQRSFAARG